MKSFAGIILLSLLWLFFASCGCAPASAQETPAPSGELSEIRVVVFPAPYSGDVFFINDKDTVVKTGVTEKECSIVRGRYTIRVIARKGFFSYWKGEVKDYDFTAKWSEKYEFTPVQEKIVNWSHIFLVSFLLIAVIGGVFAFFSLQRMKELKSKIKEAETVVQSPGESGRIPTKIDKYAVLEKIGQGGMATVYKVRDNHGDIYALKVPHSHIFAVPEFRQRFIREAEIIKTLHHENIVRMYDYNLREDIPTPFICFEYVEGESLKDFMARCPIFPVGKAVRITIDIASALGYAHSKKIVHRDIKPENVMFSKKHQVKLMDLGIARATKFKTLTATGTTLGTPQYIAPEQVATGRKDLDGRADLYSLGVIFFEMLTARLPFDSDEPMMLIMMHVAEPPPPPRSFNALIPVELESIILKLLEKEPDKRFQTAEQLIGAIKKFL